jgi:hypothetical protein
MRVRAALCAVFLTACGPGDPMDDGGVDASVADMASSTCSNGTRDGDETGVDCGGSCAACPDPKTCANAIKDGAETDVDCGGVCAPCGVGLSCTKAADCVRGACTGGKCVATGAAALSFGPGDSYGAHIEPYAVAVTDVNHDGKQDLVVGNLGSTDVSVLLGVGDGTFGGPTHVTVDGNARVVVVRDLNGDKLPDLIVGASNELGSPKKPTLDFLIGRADGTFELPIKYDTVGERISALAFADLNNDQRLDVVGVGGVLGESYLGWHLAAANGTFLPLDSAQAQVTDVLPRLALGDFNGDQIVDGVVVGNQSGNTFYLFGGGGFRPFGGAGSALTAGTDNLGHYDVLVGDFNGDTKRDIAVSGSRANFAAGNVYILLGNGDFTFQTAVPYAVGSQPSSLAQADVDLDGVPDLVAYNAFDRTASVLRGKTDGTFQSAMTFAAGGPPAPFRSNVAVGDFNQDGKPDLVIGTGAAVQVLLNTSQ